MNICYIGKRNTGKTTLLKKFFLAVIKEERGPVIILDSAVEEGNKSLINQLRAEGYIGHYFIFKNCSDVDTLKKFFLRDLTDGQPFYFDFSYCLERGNEKKGLIRNIWRNLYKNLISDTLKFILSYEWSPRKRPYLILDEIELNSKASQIIIDHLSEINFVMAIHDISYIASKKLISGIKIVYLTTQYH